MTTEREESMNENIQEIWESAFGPSDANFMRFWAGYLCGFAVGAFFGAFVWWVL